MRHPEASHSPAETSYLTPARASLDSQFADNDHLILAVSSTRTGRLYVWSRERYQDGRIGPAKLVFPTNRLRRGDNHITAGQGIRIPEDSDDPPVLELVRKPGQSTEEVIVIVAPKRLEGVAEGAPIPASQIAQWQKQWSSVVRQIDAKDRLTMTHGEATTLAGMGGGEAIMPQRFYELRADQGSNLMVAFPLVFTH
ncbi:MAG TPA: hypothetical protein VGL53_27725 [Bryobacteraceae bacterium]